MSDLRAAWGRIVEHLRAEADWRKGRDVDQMSWYQYSESLSQESVPGYCFKLEANLHYYFATLGEAATPAQFKFGDVFEHLDTMVPLGERPLGQIERELTQWTLDGGSQRSAPTLLVSAREGRCEISLRVNSRVLSDERRRFDRLDGKPPVVPEGSTCPDTEDICRWALKRTMAGIRLRRHDPSEPGGTHDVDMSFPGSGEPPVRVEFTELTSEMGEQWGKWPRSGIPRSVRAADGRLKHRWHASVNMTDTLFQQEWGKLVRDDRKRKRSGAEIDGVLLDFLEWVERQLGSIKGVVSLANQRIDPRLKPGGLLMVFPFFRAKKPPSGLPGGLTVSYDGYSVNYSTIGTSRAVEPVNQVIAHKAEKDQAGALPGEKWLVVYLDPVYAIAPILDIEAVRKSPESWLAFESKIDRRHFEEVWLVWDKRSRQGDDRHLEKALDGVRFTRQGSRHITFE